MKFFKNETLYIFSKFLWVGLIFGCLGIIFKIIAKICRKNVVIVNVLSFLYWISAGIVFSYMCFILNNYAFTFFGLVGIILGIILVKISFEFFFDYFLNIIYNMFTRKRGKNHGELQTKEKI